MRKCSCCGHLHNNSEFRCAACAAKNRRPGKIAFEQKTGSEPQASALVTDKQRRAITLSKLDKELEGVRRGVHSSLWDGIDVSFKE